MNLKKMKASTHFVVKFCTPKQMFGCAFDSPFQKNTNKEKDRVAPSVLDRTTFVILD